MPAPDIILYAKDILLSQSNGSVLGVEFDNAPFLFGVVELVSAVTNDFAVNDSIAFDPTGATKIMYGGDIYYLTKEEKIKFKEIPPP